jgi:hypothetical protein
MHSVYCEFMICYVRFSLPPHQVLNNFEGLDLGIMDKVKYLQNQPTIYQVNSQVECNFPDVLSCLCDCQIYDFGLASYIDGRVRKKKERQEEGKKRIRRLCG